MSRAARGAAVAAQAAAICLGLLHIAVADPRL